MSNRGQEQELLGAGPARGGEGIGAQELSLGFSSLWGGSAWGPCAGLSPVSTRRNLSSASQATRQKMRECHGLVDALVTYINHALDVGKCEDKVRVGLGPGAPGVPARPDRGPLCPQSVENAVCVLRNLSYRLYDEMPPSALQRLEGRGRQDMGAPPGEAVGCFTPQSRRLREVGPDWGGRAEAGVPGDLS